LTRTVERGPADDLTVDCEHHLGVGIVQAAPVVAAQMATDARRQGRNDMQARLKPRDEVHPPGGQRRAILGESGLDLA
jgi:hypothetical protein